MNHGAKQTTIPAYDRKDQLEFGPHKGRDQINSNSGQIQ